MLSNVLKFLLLEVFDNDIVTNRDLKVTCLQLSGLTLIQARYTSQGL